MSRKPRVHFPGAVYHVISRGHQKQTTFKDRDDFRQFRNFLEDAQRRFAFRLYAYVAMPNQQINQLCESLRRGRKRKYQITKA